MTLLEQLRGADEGSHELDLAIAEAMRRPSGAFGGPPLAFYTRSLDAALTLVPDGRPWNIGLETSNLHGIAWVGADGGVVTAATPELALCIAALTARGLV